MLRISTPVALIIGLLTLPQVAEATDTSVPFIHADQVHAQGITGRGVTVAGIDSAIDHADPGV